MCAVGLSAGSSTSDPYGTRILPSSRDPVQERQALLAAHRVVSRRHRRSPSTNRRPSSPSASRARSRPRARMPSRSSHGSSSSGSCTRRRTRPRPRTQRHCTRIAPSARQRSQTRTRKSSQNVVRRSGVIGECDARTQGVPIAVFYRGDRGRGSAPPSAAGRHDARFETTSRFVTRFPQGLADCMPPKGLPMTVVPALQLHGGDREAERRRRVHLHARHEERVVRLVHVRDGRHQALARQVLAGRLSASTIENASAMPATRNPSDGLPPGMYFLMIFAASAMPASFLNFGVAGILAPDDRDRAFGGRPRVELHDRRRRRDVVDVDLRLPAELVRVLERLDRELAEREDAERVRAARLQLRDLRLHVGCRRVVADRLHDQLRVFAPRPPRNPQSRSLP